jgi:hypothetical protein
LKQHLLSSQDDVIYGEPTHSGAELFGVRRLRK